MDISQDDKTVIRNILMESDDAAAVSDRLRLQIYDEFLKNDQDADFDLINENTSALLELNGQNDRYSQEAARSCIAHIRAKAKEKRAKIRSRFLLKLCTACACAVFFLTTCGLLAAQAYHINFFDNIVRFGSGFVGFNYGNTSRVQFYPNDNIKQAVKAACKQTGLFLLFPSVFPEDLKIDKISVATGPVNKIHILMSSRNDRVQADISQFTGKAPDVKVSGATNVNKVTINGRTIYLMKSGFSNQAIFYENGCVYNITTTLCTDDLTTLLSSIEWIV